MKSLYGDIVKGPLVDYVVVVSSVDHVRGVGIEHREVSGQGVMGRGMSDVVEGSESWQFGADLATGFVIGGGGVAVIQSDGARAIGMVVNNCEEVARGGGDLLVVFLF